MIFVRHALPGERVLARITDTGHDQFWRADAVEVLDASPDRVAAPCRISGPGGAAAATSSMSRPAQRRLKATVLAEQLRRLAGIEWSGAVEAVTGPEGSATVCGGGPGCATRSTPEGRAAMRAHRSHDLIALPDEGCLIANAATPDVMSPSWPAGAELSRSGRRRSRPAGRRRSRPTDRRVHEQADGHTWEVAADGFWQVHPAAADTLVAAVLAGLQPQAGERAFDLYCGVGLFAGALADAGCRVWGVESAPSASSAARRNLADAQVHVRLQVGRVDVRLPAMTERVDLVVLDPPRTGAGKAVITEILRRRPRAVAYVACDPAALARDLGTALGLGYRLTELRAYDLFPMTHHLEAVAILEPPS